MEHKKSPNISLLKTSDSKVNTEKNFKVFLAFLQKVKLPMLK